MKLLLDTSVIIDIERKTPETIKLVEEAIAGNADQIIISTVTVSEILAGAHLSNHPQAVAEAKKVLAQFGWVELTGTVAEITGAYLAYLQEHDADIGYPDTVIAATCAAVGADCLVTWNKKDFMMLPDVAARVCTPAELKSLHKK